MNIINHSEISFGTLPGLEEYVVPLQPLTIKKEKDSHRDLYNLRLLKGLKSIDIYGFPQVKSWSPIVVSTPLAFHEARALYRKRRTLKGYFVHFFIDDALFECIRKRPEMYLAMLKTADFIIAPDFSTYRNFPYPILVKNAFDNMLLAAYYQREGCNVVTNVTWSRPIFYDITFCGQPIGGTICVSSKSINLRDKKGLQLWLHGYTEVIKRLSPKYVIRIGKIIPGEEKIFSNPIRREVANPYINRIRHGR